MAGRSFPQHDRRAVFAAPEMKNRQSCGRRRWLGVAPRDSKMTDVYESVRKDTFASRQYNPSLLNFR
jgi:hypothetical protein